MIASLRGKVSAIEDTSLVIEVGGLGYLVYVPASVRDSVNVGETIVLHTRLVVREDNWTLCGFETKESREYFNLLLGVSGIGPRIAILILSTLSPDTIRRAIFTEQADVFCRVPGIGKKTAQKILLYLQDRMPTTDTTGLITALTDIDSEVLSALTALGYSVVEAQSALQYIPRDTPQDVEIRLRIALQYFAS